MAETLQAIIAITLIDLAMSGDNALVIGMVARGLPKSQRRRAIVIGAGGAVAIRVAAAAAVTILLTIQYLQLIGGLALVVIAYRLIRPETANHGRTLRPVTTLRAAVITILAADFAMSLENILGVGAAAHGNIPLLLFGLGLSIPIVLFGSGFVITILDRFPQATWLGALAILWTAAELILAEPALAGVAAIPFVELLLTLAFLAVVAAARWRRAAFALVRVRTSARHSPDGRRERRAS